MEYQKTDEEKKKTIRIMLTVAYDGTNYCGWQVQPNGISIQKTLQNAIEDLVGEKINLTGASRTDSGVHALGQVAVFDTGKVNIAPERFAQAINQRLPRDIVVQESREVPADFHPRYTDVESPEIQAGTSLIGACAVRNPFPAPCRTCPCPGAAGGHSG